MSSSKITCFTPLHGKPRNTTRQPSATPRPPAQKRLAHKQGTRAARRLRLRSYAATLLRHALRVLLVCGALYALYTMGLYLLFRDRLFYSLFIARSLML